VSDEAVVITRVFDVPREVVFKAWTDPDQLASWWGPVGFDTPRESVEVDLRVGGRVDLSMVGEGADYPLKFEILELVEPELIAFRSEPMPELGLTEPTIIRVEFHDEGGKTRMTLTDGPYPEALRADTEAGWSSSFDKLERLLAS
jgi:uncharacterized protein YndB with AHSA1/START domain